MVQLDKALRSQGGKNRAKNQNPEDRRLQAIIAASRRPLLNDVKMTPEQLLSSFREWAESRHWFRFFLIAADCTRIPRTLSDLDVLRRLKEAGGPIGFLGVTMLGTNVQTFYKPLRRGVTVIEDLDRVSREVSAEVLEQLGQVELED